MENGNKETTKKLSVVIATYNRPKSAYNLAVQIRQTQMDVQIIIVDQMESAQCETAKLSANNIEYINLDTPHLTRARNAGLSKSIGDIVLYLDDDVEITKDTLSEHVRAYSDLDVVGVAGRVINDGETVPQISSVETGKTNFLKTFFLQQFWSTKKQTVDFPYGCNMSYRTSILKKIGGFDIFFSRIFDEIDMGLRMKKEGDILFIPSALVYHHKAKSGGIRLDEELKKQELIFKNYGYIIKKHLPFPFTLITLILRTVTALKHGIKPMIALYDGFFISSHATKGESNRRKEG